MDEKLYSVLTEAYLTAPMLLSLGEFDKGDEDTVERVTEHRNYLKKNPDSLTATIKFIFENGFIEDKYIKAILQNEALTQDALFYLLFFLINEERQDVHEDDVSILELGSLHQAYDSTKFEWFLIDHISSHPIRVAKNILSSRRVLKKLVLQKGTDCIALESAIYNPNMDFDILDILAESFYLAHRDSVIKGEKSQMQEGADNAKELLGVDEATSKIISVLFLQPGFACASVHLELMKRTPEVAEIFIREYNVQYKE